VAEGASPMVVLGTHLQLGRYHATNARRGTKVSSG